LQIIHPNPSVLEVSDEMVLVLLKLFPHMDTSMVDVKTNLFTEDIHKTRLCSLEDDAMEMDGQVVPKYQISKLVFMGGKRREVVVRPRRHIKNAPIVISSGMPWTDDLMKKRWGFIHLVLTTKTGGKCTACQLDSEAEELTGAISYHKSGDQVVFQGTTTAATGCEAIRTFYKLRQQELALAAKASLASSRRAIER
jgi:hypothetical protein